MPVPSFVQMYEIFNVSRQAFGPVTRTPRAVFDSHETNATDLTLTFLKPCNTVCQHLLHIIVPTE